MVDNLQQFTVGWGEQVTNDAFKKLVGEFNRAHSHMLLLGDEDVVVATEKIMSAYDNLEEAAGADQAESLEGRLRAGYFATWKEFLDREKDLIAAMRSDIEAARRTERIERESGD